jgi:GT2 family glycosyltransferase
MNKKKVAIILVNWNSFGFTNDCINSLKEINYSNYDIIVVDNGSNDESGNQLKEKHPEIILITSPTNTGFTGGNNLGMQYAIKNNYLYSLLLNNDTFVEKNFLSVLVEYMDIHSEVGAIQPKIYFNHNREIIWNGGSHFNRLWGFTYSNGYLRNGLHTNNEIKKVDWITGCAFFIRNTVLKETGLLAENLFIYAEDADLSLRIRNKGYQLVYHPQSIIYHIAGMSNKNKVKGKEGYLNPVVHYLSQRNRIWFLKKHTPLYFAPTVFLFNFCYSVSIILYFVVRGRFNKLKAIIKGIKDGLSGHIEYK